MERLNTAKETHVIADNAKIEKLNAQIEKLTPGNMEIINQFQEAINLKAYNGEYGLYIDETHPLFNYIMKYDIRSILTTLGYKVEACEQRVSSEESETVGYTIRW